MKFTVVFVCDIVKKPKNRNRVENNANGNGVTRNNEPLGFLSFTSSSSLRVTVEIHLQNISPTFLKLSLRSMFSTFRFECVCVCVFEGAY